MKNHKIIFFLKQSRGEENKRRRAHTYTQLLKKKNIGVCTAFIVFMINLANLEINDQLLSLNLSLTLSLMYLCIKEYTNLYDSRKRCRLQRKYQNILTKPKL